MPLRALQLAGERGRSEQGGLLPGAAADAGHDPHLRARLAAVAAVLPARALAEQVRRLEKKVGRDVLAALPALSLQIVEFAREHGLITMAEAIRLTGASRNTLKPHFRGLIERGHLTQQRQARRVVRAGELTHPPRSASSFCPRGRRPSAPGAAARP